MTKKITTLAAEFVDLFLKKKKNKKGKFSYLLICIKWNCVAMHFSHSGSEMTPGTHHYPNIYLCLIQSSWAIVAVLFYWKRVHSSLKADRYWFKIQLYYYWLQSISDHALLFHPHKEPPPWTQIDINNYHLPLLITHLPHFKSVHNAITEHRWGICKLINDWCPNKKV